MIWEIMGFNSYVSEGFIETFAFSAPLVLGACALFIYGPSAMSELTVSGWLHDIGKGQASIAEDGQRTFSLVEK
jgi:hypothetical protein